jgi:hypothetical protein
MSRKVPITTAVAAATLAVTLLAGCTPTGHSDATTAAQPKTTTQSADPAPARAKAPTTAAPAALKVGDQVQTWTSEIPDDTVLYPNGDGTYTLLAQTGALPAAVQAKAALSIKTASASGDGAAEAKAIAAQAANTGHTLILYGWEPASSAGDAGYYVLVSDGRMAVPQPSEAAALAQAERDAAELGPSAALIPLG